MTLEQQIQNAARFKIGQRVNFPRYVPPPLDSYEEPQTVQSTGIIQAIQFTVPGNQIRYIIGRAFGSHTFTEYCVEHYVSAVE